MAALIMNAVFPESEASGRRNLHERETAHPLRIDLEQAFDGIESLDDALGVVQPLDPDAEFVSAWEIQADTNVFARLRNRFCRRQRLRRPLDGDRIRVDGRDLATARHVELLAVDPRFKKAIDGVQEIVAVVLGMKAENAAAQQTVQNLRSP